MNPALLFVLGLAAAAFIPRTARADSWSGRGADDAWDGAYEQRAVRRSGFAASANLGFGVSAALGYPNEIAKIDEREYETSLGASFSSINTIWVGGALRDWFNFGLGIWGVGAKKGDIEMQSGGFMLHVEAFPLWTLGGRLPDLSVYANLGPGGLTLKGGPEEADGGAVSFINLGTSFELFRLKYVALGPTLDGFHMYSQSARATGGYLGVRATIYGGP